jgi:hypothetical protein
LLVFLGRFVPSMWSWLPYWTGDLLWWLLCTGLPILVVVALLAFPIPALYRRRLRMRAREHLPVLSPEQLREALLPLQREGGDLRKIVDPLLRELRVPAEVSPADAPAGRGDEATAVE